MQSGIARADCSINTSCTSYEEVHQPAACKCRGTSRGQHLYLLALISILASRVDAYIVQHTQRRARRKETTLHSTYIHIASFSTRLLLGGDQCIPNLLSSLLTLGTTLPYIIFLCFNLQILPPYRLDPKFSRATRYSLLNPKYEYLPLYKTIYLI